MGVGGEGEVGARGVRRRDGSSKSSVVIRRARARLRVSLCDTRPWKTGQQRESRSGRNNGGQAGNAPAAVKEAPVWKGILRVD